ncbi:hypothetical protein [Clostridium sp.]|uniref:hypothetical protein n=1 Tax=Clostridium sp. TaxID=1506 RepID=UPI0025C5384C|nr:hypothetical protein [Clostridium sp.]
MKRELTLEEQIMEMEDKLAELKARKEEEDRNKPVVESMYLNTSIFLDDFYKGYYIDCSIENLNIEISERIVGNFGEIQVELYCDNNKVIEESHTMRLYKFKCEAYKAEVVKYLINKCISKLYSIHASKIKDGLERMRLL